MLILGWFENAGGGKLQAGIRDILKISILLIGVAPFASLKIMLEKCGMW